MPAQHHLRFALLVPLALAAAASAAVTLTSCSPDSNSPPARCTSTASCPAGQVCRDGVCAVVRDGGPGSDAGLDAGGPPIRDIVSISIDPPSADLVSTDGSMPEQVFAVLATLRDGTIVPAVGPSFALDSLSTGAIDVASGRFVANGVIGGAATVTGTVMGATGPLTATATVTVHLERELLGAGVPADAPARFAGPLTVDPSRAAGLVYPLDHAVMPQNVYPADLQWLNGDAGDLFRATLTKPHVTVVAYLIHSGAGFENDWLVDADAWRSLAQTDPDADMTLVVDRWIAASAEPVAGAPLTVTFARAALAGSVYYWDIQRGRIVRINDGSATRDEFMPSPPVAADGARCVGCHTVSNSGRYMAGRLGGGENIGAVFDLTLDLSGDPPPTIYPLSTGTPNSQHWWFSSWSPDDSRMVITTAESSTRAMRFMDPFAGVEVAVTGTLPTNATHPAWAPDDSAIAYAANVNAWGGGFTLGDIATFPLTGPDAVGASTVIHRGTDLAASSPPGSASSYPSWTPDSARIAFSNGTGCRSEIHQSALYIMARDGSGVARLDNANGSTTDNFQPRFSPFDSGGYFWMSFLSRRDYGNALAGTRGSGFQQIWVSAIRNDGSAGGDQSAVPYWLPGQNTESRNISAYWAPRACRPDGESCSVGSECCGGDCRPDGSGALVCAPTPPDRCRERDETCSTDGDCCEGLVCFSNVCIEPPT